MQSSRPCYSLAISILIFLMTTMAGATQNADPVQIQQGTLQGTATSDGEVRMFLGIPYAAPPVGNLRWREPEAAPSWHGIRAADKFGARCMQAPLFADMKFRDSMSEDCLYLNIWTPAKSASEKLPVMVWIHGGGFAAGSASEPRQDGQFLATKGVVVVGINYRLGIFGFFAHPELAKESGHKASGNYGLLDQVAALKWVRDNIAGFGGDPANVTIFGESAGSMSVSALMASPLAQELFQRAIGESGGFFGRPMTSLKDSEKQGKKFAKSVGARSIADLRSKSAEDILASAPKYLFPNVDGYFLPASVSQIFEAGKQNRVPLLAGWNMEEGKANVLFAKDKPSASGSAEFARKTYKKKAGQFLALYPAGSDEEAYKSAVDLAGDQFIVFSTWKWIDTDYQTGKSPVYRYRFDQIPLTAPDAKAGSFSLRDMGVRHSGEIEYVFSSFPLTGVEWQDEDRKLSDLIATYWTNFAKTGDPNGDGVPQWPAYQSETKYEAMHFVGTGSKASPEVNRARYEFLDANQEWMKPRK
jgi:para-nitrobenzyl esterase